MYCKKNNRVQTSEVNVIFYLIHTLSRNLKGVKKEELVKNNQFSALVTADVDKSNFYKDLERVKEYNLLSQKN